MSISKGFVKKLSSQYKLKILERSTKDISQIIKINSLVHGSEIEDFTKHLCYDHPNKDEILWFFIEEKQEIVSCMALLPLDWLFQGINLKIAEMGMVGTLENYRGQGLFGKMNEIYEQAMIDRGYFISVLRGIPYYYRKFGYEFLLPLNQRVKLSSDKIPIDEIKNLRIKNASGDDIPVIQKLYEANYKNSLISNKFDQLNFADKFISGEISDYKFSTYIIEGSDPVAFFSIGNPFGKSKDLILCSEMTSNQILKCFHFLKSINDKEIVVDQNLETTISRYAIELGGEKNKGWEWQVKILSHQKFFETIKPALEERIKNSRFNKMSKVIEISNYKENIKIEFVDGLIMKIESFTGYPNSITCDLRIPGTMLTKLLFGEKSVEEIKQLFPDAIVKAESDEIIQILFPKMNSYPGSYY